MQKNPKVKQKGMYFFLHLVQKFLVFCVQVLNKMKKNHTGKETTLVEFKTILISESYEHLIIGGRHSEQELLF